MELDAERLNPFRFPLERHRRTVRPPGFTAYRHFKSCLREEFRRKCVYCRLPDTLFPSTSSFGVDHYWPKTRYPEKDLDYSNLFYACNDCNRRKGTILPSDLAFIPNPCDHRMADHLQFAGESVRARSEIGHWMIDVLQLGREDVVRYRGVIIRRIHRSVAALEELLEQKMNLEGRIHSVPAPDLPQLREDLKELEQFVQENWDELSQLCGEVLPPQPRSGHRL